MRDRVGIAFEEAFLFSDTIRANIAYGRPDATDDEIRAAADAAQAAEFIDELADGYDTVVGERGLTLSGGQRQRIALARLLLADPDIAVLDDATSAVDAAVEAEIHAALRGWHADRTMLLVAHRESTARLADRVVAARGRPDRRDRHPRRADRGATRATASCSTPRRPAPPLLNPVTTRADAPRPASYDGHRRGATPGRGGWFGGGGGGARWVGMMAASPQLQRAARRAPAGERRAAGRA